MLPGMAIGDECLIEAGSMAIEDIEKNSLVVGYTAGAIDVLVAVKYGKIFEQVGVPTAIVETRTRG